MNYDVCGLGNPLIDIIANVDELIVEELGLVKGSMNLVEVERQNRILEKLEKKRINTALGGSCANTMVMLAQLGGKAAYGGKLGNDDLAEDYESQLVNRGVTSLLKHQEGATGSTIILVTPDAERTMNTHLGMCRHFSKDDLDPKAIKNSRYLYVEGYLWDSPKQKETVVNALEHAKSAGTKIALTLSDSFCVERHKDEFQELMDNYVDLLFCNETEAGLMTGVEQPEEQLNLMSRSVDHIVLTLGKKGSKVLHSGDLFDIDAFNVKAVDTTGAGDCFAAGYLYGITQNYPVQQAGILASYCAAIIVAQDGPRFQGDLRSEVGEYLIK